jgi:hypothetical protein
VISINQPNHKAPEKSHATGEIVGCNINKYVVQNLKINRNLKKILSKIIS